MSSASLGMTDLPLVAWSGSRDPFFKFFPNHIFVIGEARHFKFRVLIDTVVLLHAR